MSSTRRKSRVGKGRSNERLRCSIEHLNRAGLNQSEIARRLGTSRQRINQLVNPNYSRYEPKGSKRTRHDREQVAALLRWQGWPNCWIAEYLGVSDTSITYWMRRVRVPPARIRIRRRS